METYSSSTPTQPANDATTGVRSELMHDAKSLGAKAVDRAHSEVDARKSGAVPQVQAVSGAVSQVAENLGDGAPAWLKSSLEQGARQIQTFADTLERKDSRQLMDDVNVFARNSPGTFLAACGAAGFAAARLFKAGTTGTGTSPSEPATATFSASEDAPTPLFGDQQTSNTGRGTGGFSDSGFSDSDGDFGRQGSGTLV
jgi:hypothetical protein